MVKLDTWIAANEMEKVGDKAKLNIRGLIFFTEVEQMGSKGWEIAGSFMSCWLCFCPTFESLVSDKQTSRRLLINNQTYATRWPYFKSLSRANHKKERLLFFKFNHLCVEESVDDLASASIVWIRFAKKTPGNFFYTFLRIELRRQKLAAPSEVRKSVSYFKAFWKFGNKKCLGPFAIFAIHVKLMEPDLLPGSELGSRRWVMQQIWFRPVDAGRPEESLTCCRRLYKSRSKMLIGINWQK